MTIFLGCLLLFALGYGARWGLGSNASYAVHDVDGRHGCGVCPPQFTDDFISGQPGVGLFYFIGDEDFGGVDGSVLGYQVLVGRDAGDPGGAGGELMIEHELVRGEAQSFGSAERGHDSDELLVDDFAGDFVGDSVSARGGRVRQRCNGMNVGMRRLHGRWVDGG